MRSLATIGVYGFDASGFLAALEEALPSDRVSVLLCVERDPAARHRSLIAQRMADECGVSVSHLLP